MAEKKLPSVIGNLTPEGNLSRYLDEIKRFPMLSAEDEYTLAKNWKENDNLEAAHKLVTSHLRLVAKIAMGYRGYGLPMGELIAEGNLGMMHAVKRFEPEKGFRLSTYAMWWIRASIQEYILRSWSLVKIGTTAAQKKLFFNLRRIKGEIKAIDDGDMRPEQVTEIAQQLDVPEMEVINMNRRLGSGDHSLNASVGGDGEITEWQDWLEDGSDNQEVTFAEAEEYDNRRQLLVAAMDELNDREVEIIKARRLSDTPLTLEELSQRFGVSRERIRQIESRAFEKLQISVRDRAIETNLIEQ
ncbi:MAG TPA: RNA polymerase sigma factor RpoH [Alphaproteobacteria bacterium]|nr:RNA polymerase sigma factor RpoH [Alphaproteobacteria bacterium]